MKFYLLLLANYTTKPSIYTCAYMCTQRSIYQYISQGLFPPVYISADTKSVRENDKLLRKANILEFKGFLMSHLLILTRVSQKN